MIKARFTLNGTPATDPSTGDRLYSAVVSEVIIAQLESSLGVKSVTYSLVDAADPASPKASLSAPAINWSVSGTPAETPPLPDQASQFTLPASGVHSYVVRASVVLDDDTTQVFERLVVIPSTCGSRKTVPEERQEGNSRGWSDVQNKQVECSGGSGTPEWEIFVQNDVTTVETDTTTMFSPVLTGSNQTITGRVELFAFESSTDSVAAPFVARLAFNFTFFESGLYFGFEPNVGVLVTGIPGAIISELGSAAPLFSTGTLALTFDFVGGFTVKAVHAVGFAKTVKWCATLYANECEGPIPDDPGS